MVNKINKQTALILARAVRDGLENLHAEGICLTDENMPKVNKAIRDSLFGMVTIFREFKDKPKQLDEILKWKQPAEYRETDNFEEIEKKVRKIQPISML